MIYDSFLFYNELELLDIRLNTLNDVVDKFVLVEATVTHTNKPKILFYEKNKARFKKFHNKIIHVIVKDTPNVSLPWIIERFQFEAAVRGLKNCKPADIILHGPVDEIPNPKKIKEYAKKPGKIKTFVMNLSYYYLNFMKTGKPNWEGTRMFLYKEIPSFQSIYFTRYFPTDVYIANGGWHFSYIGGVKRIQQKLASMAHQEFNNEKFNTPEKIQKAIIQGKDFFELGHSFAKVDLNRLPKYVVENREKFKDYLLFSQSNSLFKHLYGLVLEFKNSIRIHILRNLKKFTA